MKFRLSLHTKNAIITGITGLLFALILFVIQAPLNYWFSSPEIKISKLEYDDTGRYTRNLLVNVSIPRFARKQIAHQSFPLDPEAYGVCRIYLKRLKTYITKIDRWSIHQIDTVSTDLERLQYHLNTKFQEIKLGPVSDDISWDSDSLDNEKKKLMGWRICLDSIKKHVSLMDFSINLRADSTNLKFNIQNIGKSNCVIRPEVEIIFHGQLVYYVITDNKDENVFHGIEVKHNAPDKTVHLKLDPRKSDATLNEWKRFTKKRSLEEVEMTLFDNKKNKITRYEIKIANSGND